MALGLTASRSSSAFARGLLRSTAAWALRASLSSCCIFCRGSFSPLCGVILRCAPRQVRVASLTIKRRPIFIQFHTCTDVDFACAENSSLTSAYCWLHWQWLLTTAFTLLLVLDHLHAVLLETVSTVHSRLRSTRPRETVLALSFA